MAVPKELVDVMSKIRHFTNFDQYTKALGKKETQRYYLSKRDPFKDLQFDVREGIFTTNLKVADNPELAGVHHRDFKVIPYAMLHLYDELGTGNLNKLIRKTTETTICEVMNINPKEIPEYIDPYFDPRRQRTIQKTITDENIESTTKMLITFLNKINNLYRGRSNRVRSIVINETSYGSKANALFPTYVTSFKSDRFVDFDERQLVIDLERMIKKNNPAMSFERGSMGVVHLTGLFLDETKFNIFGDDHFKGVRFQHSNDKFSAYQVAPTVFRMKCTNCIWAVLTLLTFSKGHIGKPEDFNELITKGTIDVLGKQDTYLNMYRRLEKHDGRMFDNWEDILKFQFIKFNQTEKKKLYEVGEVEKYGLTPYGVINAITHMGSHESYNYRHHEKINREANRILNNLESMVAIMQQTATMPNP